MIDPCLPFEAEIVDRVEESEHIFTLRLRLTDPGQHEAYRFRPGQFNMVYLYGVGEVPISIVSDPESDELLDHTIRVVGRVTRALSKLRPGERIGLRGPFGRGWPLRRAEGRDVLIVTGGLGCAPVVSVINYVMRRRERFGRLTVMQGVKHSADLIWRAQYERWTHVPDTQVLLAADVGGTGWPWYVGPVTVLFEQVAIDPAATLAMMCGPEPMMRVAAKTLLHRGLADEDLWLSMERNMQCGTGHCGHCQVGDLFVCKDGPVFPFSEVKQWLGIRGF